MRVELVWAEAGRAWRQSLTLPAGSSAGDALQALRDLAPDWPAASLQPVGLAVFGREIDATTPLREGDRLELLRALLADPKEARRRRAARKR